MLGPHHHLYNNQRWRSARLRFLALHPFCGMCQQQGQLTRATVVDHSIPHRGNARLFWDSSLWRPLCKLHHDSTKARMEGSKGGAPGSDADGLPLDASHPWHAAVVRQAKGKG